MVKKISVLRLGHRIYRDIRTTTHCALTSRALGTDEIIISGEEDKEIEKTIKKVVSRWGGKFKIRFSDNPLKEIKQKKKEKYTIVHLTMYGEQIEKKIKNLKKKEKILIIIGGKKVPPQIYKESDYNISIGNQPHSEIAALAIILHELFERKELKKKFRKPKIQIIPQKTGKKTKKSD